MCVSVADCCKPGVCFLAATPDFGDFFPLGDFGLSPLPVAVVPGVEDYYRKTSIVESN